MSLLDKLNNRCITNNFLKGDRGPIGPIGPPGSLPYYTIKSNQSSNNKWSFDLSVLPSVIRTSNGLEDKDISFSYDFIIAETSTTLAPSSTTPSCGKIDWINAQSNQLIVDGSLNDLGSNITINNTTINVIDFQSYASGSFLGKETNIRNGTHYQSIMYYYITNYDSDTILAQNNCDVSTSLNCFTNTSVKITKNAYTILNIEIKSGGITTSNKYLYLYLTPTFLFNTR
jgi:hypothetical protein